MTRWFAERMSDAMKLKTFLTRGVEKLLEVNKNLILSQICLVSYYMVVDLIYMAACLFYMAAGLLYMVKKLFGMDLVSSFPF